jgi:hypothetical protein
LIDARGRSARSGLTVVEPHAQNAAAETIDRRFATFEEETRPRDGSMVPAPDEASLIAEPVPPELLPWRDGIDVGGAPRTTSAHAVRDRGRSTGLPAGTQDRRVARQIRRGGAVIADRAQSNAVVQSI